MSRPPLVLTLRDAARLALLLQALDAQRIPTIPAFSPALVSHWIALISAPLVALDLDVRWSLRAGAALVSTKRRVVAISDDEDRVIAAINQGFSEAIPYSIPTDAMAGRLEALMRSPLVPAPALPMKPTAVGDLLIDRCQRRAWWKGEALRLSRNQFDQLAFFAANAGVIVPNEELCEEFFGLPSAHNALNVAVHRLRRALPTGLASALESRRDYGYGLLLEARLGAAANRLHQVRGLRDTS